MHKTGVGNPFLMNLIDYSDFLGRFSILIFETVKDVVGRVCPCSFFLKIALENLICT
jgi:hypothetical protein